MSKVKNDPTKVASCGGCTACCKVMGAKVEEGERRLSDSMEDGSKPPGEWCVHCALGGAGCTIYTEPDKPEVCDTFECWWLQSQRTDSPMAENLRPDKSRGIFVSQDDIVTLNVDKAYWGNWRKGILSQVILTLGRAGLPVFVVCGQDRYAVSPAAAQMVVKANGGSKPG